MNNEMLKIKKFEEYVNSTKDKLLNSTIPFSSLTYHEYFEDESSKETHFMLKDSESKYYKAIENVALFPNYVSEIIKQKSGDQRTYYSELVKRGYLNNSITFEEYLEISHGGKSTKHEHVIEASMKYREELKVVSSDEMYRFLFEKIRSAKLGDYLNYLWRYC